MIAEADGKHVFSLVTLVSSLVKLCAAFALYTDLRELYFVFQRGNTALHAAAEAGYIKVVELLIEYGASSLIENKVDFFHFNGNTNFYFWAPFIRIAVVGRLS